MSTNHTDVIFIDTLRLSADVGPDCWGVSRPQPVHVSVYIHLQPSFLDVSGQSDNVLETVDYGHLTKAISSKVEGASFHGVDALVDAVNREAYALAEKAAQHIRVVVDLPEQILLAENFSVDITTSASSTSKSVLVKNLILPVIIGVNQPEREAKQKVITNIAFYERPSAGQCPFLDYPAIVTEIIKNMEKSSYLTLEKFVLEIVRTACLLAPDSLDHVTVRSQKPSALRFGHSSGVEITRRKVDFV